MVATLLTLETTHGTIRLRLLPTSAPQTVAHIINLVQSKTYNGTSFYHSDFALQFGLHGSSTKHNPYSDLTINETGGLSSANRNLVSNMRGTVVVAHFDVPDNGNSELFINLTDNPHLDTVYGGYCVFARVEGAESFDVVDRVADVVKRAGKVDIHSARMSE